jgi:hypothetical protein
MTNQQAIAVVENGRSAAMWFRMDDGGVHKTRFADSRGDCVARAIAIATELPYMKVHRELYRRQRAYVHELFERKHGRPPDHTERSTGELLKLEQPRTGSYSGAYRPWLEELGWTYTRTPDSPQEATGDNSTTADHCEACGSHGPPEHGPRLGVDPLPDGPVIVVTFNHLCAVVDGVLCDAHARAIGRVILGFYQPKTTAHD